MLRLFYFNVPSVLCLVPAPVAVCANALASGHFNSFSSPEFHQDIRSFYVFFCIRCACGFWRWRVGESSLQGQGFFFPPFFSARGGAVTPTPPQGKPIVIIDREDPEVEQRAFKALRVPQTLDCLQAIPLPTPSLGD